MNLCVFSLESSCVRAHHDLSTESLHFSCGGRQPLRHLTMKISLPFISLLFLATGPQLVQAANVWNRAATFLSCTQEDANCNTDVETVAEIVAISNDGNTAIYTDSAAERLGLVDISNPRQPKPAGTIALSGEPTSVTVVGDYAVVGINTSGKINGLSKTLGCRF